MSGFTLRPFRPWESVRLPQAVTLLALAVGLPLYLRSPLWCDITLYDVAARNLLQGGAHYRDVFDTNLPGYVWLLTAIRWAFGFGTVALRCVDLAIVAGIVLVVDRIARRGGATPEPVPLEAICPGAPPHTRRPRPVPPAPDSPTSTRKGS